MPARINVAPVGVLEYSIDECMKTNDMIQESGERTEQEKALITLVREMGVDMGEAVRFLRVGQRAGAGSLTRAEHYISLGREEMRKRHKTVSFQKAVEVAIEERKERRKRTQRDLTYLSHRLMRLCPGLSRRRIRTILAEECAEWIEHAFNTPSQRKKARAALSCIFSSAVRHGWCTENPILHVIAPSIRERRIRILSAEESQRLLSAAEQYRDGICLPAVAIMLYAGVRPNEVMRLTWEHVCIPEGIIRILPQHSKTGGARYVTISPRLAQVLSHAYQASHPASTICPPNWTRHWTELHRLAGWEPQEGNPWRPDVLRHTFATNHLKEHHDYTALQYEMGHRNADLLRTRYVAM